MQGARFANDMSIKTHLAHEPSTSFIAHGAHGKAGLLRNATNATNMCIYVSYLSYVSDVSKCKIW